MAGQQRGDENVVEIDELSIEFKTGRGIIHAVNEVSLSVRRGTILAVVGESGCGKSTLAFALLGLIPEPGRIVHGALRVGGVDVTSLNDSQLQRFRGERVSMVFQAAMDSFNPVITFRDAVLHILESHPGVWPNARVATEYFSELLTMVRLDPRVVLSAYPHQLSGGMKQRMAIAMALLLKPEVLVLDEPTTALDVVNQRLVLDVLRDLHSQQDITMIFVTHDLGVVADTADAVAVMYAGYLVEWGDIDNVFYGEHGQHPYVTGLLESAPSVDKARSEVHAIAGAVPDIFEKLSGCPFANRCPHARDACRQSVPSLLSVHDSLAIRCPIVLESQTVPEGGRTHWQS